MRLVHVVSGACLVVLCCLSSTHAQIAGQVDPGFNANLSQTNVTDNGPVQINTIKQQDDGSVIVGGNFSSVGGLANVALARLDAAGNPDPDFVSDFVEGEIVQAMDVGTDGDLLIVADTIDPSAITASAGGSPASTDPTGRPRAMSKVRNTLHRCSKANGKFAPGYGGFTDGTTFQIAALPGNQSLIIGSFGQVTGAAVANIARLNNDGSVDSAFAAGTDAAVRSLSVQSDGLIVVGGDFATVNGETRVGVARLNADGSLDESFDPGEGPDGTVNAVRVLANGQVLIGGSFANVDGVPRGGIARLNADGSLDDTFDPGGPIEVASAVNNPSSRRRTAAAGGAGQSSGSVMALDVQTNDKILLAGLFDALAGVARHNVLRLLADGTVDTSFDPGSGPDAAVKTVVVQPTGGRILLGGGFANVGGLPRAGAARLLGDGDVTTSDAPVVSFVVPGANGGKSTQILEGGPALKLKVVRSGGDLSQPLTVFYKPKGGNLPGTDYNALSGTVTIPAGATGAKVKVRALDDGIQDGNKTLKIKLIPADDGSYQLGVPAQAKVHIIDAQGLE